MLEPTESLARPSPVYSTRFPHTHLVRGGWLMLKPEDPVLLSPFISRPQRAQTNCPAQLLLPIVGRNITPDQTLTRWV